MRNILGKLFTQYNKLKLPLVLKQSKMKLTFDSRLREMKKLNRDLFKLEIDVPAIKIRKTDFTKIKKILQAYTVETLNKKYQNLNEDDPQYLTHKYLLLDPDRFDFSTLDKSIKDELLKALNGSNNSQSVDEIIDENGSKLVEKKHVLLAYEDLKFDDVMKAILPEALLNENISAKGYSIIGHVAHFNLRDQILDYKNIIGKNWVLFKV